MTGNSSRSDEADDFDQNASLPPFNEAIRAQRVAPGRWDWQTPEAWSQGRTLFGGIPVAAVALAMFEEVVADLDDASGISLRTIQYTFLAPISTGQASIEVTVDRRGSSATFASALLSQGGVKVARANAVFGQSRESDVVKILEPPQLDIPLTDATKIPYIEGLTPAFTRNFDMRWGTDEFPFSQSPNGKVGGYVRFVNEASGFTSILGLLDAWLPAFFTMLGDNKAVTASSVALTMHLIKDVPDYTADDWFEFRHITQSAGDGYTTQIGQLSFDGEVIGWVEQLVAVFDKR